MSGFISDDYKLPSTGSATYMKFQEGENIFRITSPCLTAWEYWNKDDRPVRSQQPFPSIPEDIRTDEEGKPERIKHIWLVTVYDYESKAHKILEIQQRTVQEGILNYARDAKWGHPCGYDIRVTKDKSKPGTQMYSTTVSPKEPLSMDALLQVYSRPYDLYSVIADGDPTACDESDTIGEAGRTLLNQYRKERSVTDDQFKSDMADVQGGKADSSKLNGEQAIALVSLYASKEVLPDGVPF